MLRTSFRRVSVPTAALAGFVCALLPLLLTGCGGSDAAAGNSGGPPPPTLVRVARVEQREVAPRVAVVGTVRPLRVSVVASGADGLVTNFYVDHGDYVHAGTLLSKLRMDSSDREIAQAEALVQEYAAKLQELQAGRPEDIRRAQALLQAAQAVEANAQSQRDRIRNLRVRGAANDAEMENAEERWKAAQQATIAAQAELKRAQEGGRLEERQQAEARLLAQREQVAWLKLEQDKRTTEAPFSGFVVAEHSEEGQWLSKGASIVTLAEMDQVEITVNVDQWALQHLQLGQSATVQIDGVHPEQWTGTVVQIVPRSAWESGSRGFPVIVRVDNVLNTETVTRTKKNQQHSGQNSGSPSDATPTETVERIVPVLKEGMMARVTFEGRRRQAMMVPKDALVRDLRGTFMHLFTPIDPKAVLNPEKPTLGRTQQVPVVVDLSLSRGEWTAVALSPEMPGGPVEFTAGTIVVTEGGERLRPVQENIGALERMGAVQ